LKKVVGIVCRQDSAALPANSIDHAFICDTYHHFESPRRRWPRSTGRCDRAGKSSWSIFATSRAKLVRAGQEVFTPGDSGGRVQANRGSEVPQGEVLRSLQEGRSSEGPGPL